MQLRRFVSAVTGAAILFAAACVPTVSAWSVYDTEYGEEYYEGSKTAVTIWSK